MGKSKKFKGVYQNASNGMYYYATKIKQDDGTYKSIKSKSIYESAIQCYSALLKVKDVVDVVKETDTSLDDMKITGSNVKIINNQPQRYGSNKMFNDVVVEYLNLFKSKNKESTYYVSQSRINKAIVPLFENLTINFACSSRALVEFKNHLKNIPVSNTYRNQILGHFIQICEFAFYSNYITQQEFGLVKLSLIKFKENAETTASKTKKREKKFYTLDEFNQFIEVVDDEQYKLIFNLLFYGGFRKGELLALKVNDFDVEKSLVRVSKTLNNQGKITTTKSVNGVRNVYLKKDVATMLKNYIESCNLQPNDLLFTMSNVTIINKASMWMKKANLENLNLHGFRHSCCSLLLDTYKKHNIAIDFKQVAQFLGDKVDTILEVYYHLYGNESTRIIDLLD